MGTDLARRALARPDALTLAPRVTRSLARFRDAAAFNQPLNKWNTRSVTNMYYMWVLTSPAVRSLAPRVTRSLARFEGATDFNQALNSWDTSSVTRMSFMWVLTSPAVRPPAPTRSRSRSLRASLARSPGSTEPLTSPGTLAAGS